ncbi:MAG: ankyrin repeat domain-containing protein [Planctomycetes bacterium]|nr:ankyrin repeat domain-containing protein [Planctomycetota bacterium]
MAFAACLFAIPGIADEARANSKDTRLADAAEAEDWPLVEQLLDEGIDNQSPHPDGMTALHWAVYRNHATSIGRLIDAGGDVNAETRYRVTPISIACQHGRPEIVAKLLSGGADVNKTLPGGETPLMIAARTGDVRVIRHLVKAKAQINATERRGQTALMWAAGSGNAEAVDELIVAGAKANEKTKLGFTAIMFAARDGRGKVVRRLLAAGVDVNAVMTPNSSGDRVPRKGTSALTLAVESGHFELALFLINEGANPNDQRNGFTPLHAITWVRKPNRGENSNGDPPPRGSGNLTSLQFVRAIVAAGADVNAQLKSGRGGRAVLNRKDATPFLLAAKTADLPLLKTLIDLGADPTLTNVDGSNAIMACAGVGVRAVGEEAGTESEVLETLDYLLELGLDINAVDQNKETAMHGAAYRNFPRVVEFLAAQGADPAAWNHKNEYGWTPVMIAQGNRPGSFKPSPETVAALRAAMVRK